MDKGKLYRYLKGEATEAELKEINGWIDESAENRRYLAELKATWVLSTMPDTKSDIRNFVHRDFVRDDIAGKPHGRKSCARHYRNSSQRPVQAHILSIRPSA